MLDSGEDLTQVKIQTQFKSIHTKLNEIRELLENHQTQIDELRIQMHPNPTINTDNLRNYQEANTDEKFFEGVDKYIQEPNNPIPIPEKQYPHRQLPLMKKKLLSLTDVVLTQLRNIIEELPEDTKLI